MCGSLGRLSSISQKKEPSCLGVIQIDSWRTARLEALSVQMILHLPTQGFQIVLCNSNLEPKRTLASKLALRRESGSSLANRAHRSSLEMIK
jgi:hypothetical protein